MRRLCKVSFVSCCYWVFWCQIWKCSDSFGPDGGRFEVVVDAKMGIFSPKINILAALYAPYLFCYYRINNWARAFCAFPSSLRPTNSKRFKINSIKIGMQPAHPTPVLNFVLLPFSCLLPCFNERLPV